MRFIFKKLLGFITHVQVLSVFLAFALMVFFSYNYMSNIERLHLLDNVNYVIHNTQEKILSSLKEPSTALGIISENVRSMILRGADQDEVRENFFNISNYIINNGKSISSAVDYYGYFNVFNDKFISSSGWMPPDDYVMEERPWYKAAINADGNAGMTEPYFDSKLDKLIITFSRCIFDNDGNQLAVICLDYQLDEIQEFAINAYVTEDSYGILFDKEFNVIAHPVPGRFLGRNLKQMNDGEAIAEILKHDKRISERKVWDYNQNESVGFFRQLENGWYFSIIAYANKYYKSVRDIGSILMVLGLILALSLIFILLSVVTGKKKAEERNRILLDSMPLCANFLNSKYVNIDCNNAALKLFDIAGKKEYLEKYDSLSPEYQLDGRLSREKAAENIKKAFDEGYNRYEWLHRKLNGELIPCEVTLVKVKFRNEDTLCVYTRDLREMKSMISKMREADECTQVLFDATPLSCLMIDNTNRILECNNEIVKLFGLTSKKQIFVRFQDFSPEHQPSGGLSGELFKKYLFAAFEEGQCNFEWMNQTITGEQIPTEISLVRVKYKGVYAVAAYIRDLREIKAMIAEMRRAEIAEESSKAKSDFLAKMSHEIRTPMNAILGIAEIQLQDNTLPLINREALERIYNSGDLLLGIINDILDLSKIEACKLELVNTQYEVASLIHDIVKLNTIRYESKPIEFKLSINEKVPTMLTGDELRIKQILNNLLSNAFKYTNEGQIELSFFMEDGKDKDNITLVFSVSDTGQGMTADQLKKLGDKFSRFNLETNRQTEGTGLGMNITRNLIQLMDGEINIESTPGLGSTFTVRLLQGCVDSVPIGADLAENLMKLNLVNTARVRSIQVKQEFMPYGRVLIVDDVETNLYVARGLLAPYGLSVDTVLSGFEAVDKIRDGFKYDIIFMDHMMPRMDGIEAARMIRSLGYTQPIVALTANALSGQAEMFLVNGFDDFISKPIDIRQLNGVLNKLIRDQQPQEVLDEARRQRNILYASGKHNIAVDSQLSEFFIRDAEKAINVLESICKNNCRRADDIPILIINIHSMKSALANVGENELSDKAMELEQAGRDNNINLILSALPDFLKSLQEIIEKLKPADDEIPVTEDTQFLNEKLAVIRNACASFDKKTAKEAVNELKQMNWSKSTRNRLSAITEHLLHSEFDEAAAFAMNN